MLTQNASSSMSHTAAVRLAVLGTTVSRFLILMTSFCLFVLKAKQLGSMRSFSITIIFFNILLLIISASSKRLQ